MEILSNQHRERIYRTEENAQQKLFDSRCAHIFTFFMEIQTKLEEVAKEKRANQLSQNLMDQGHLSMMKSMLTLILL